MSRASGGSATESALYVGAVMHRRLRPTRHALRYRMFSLLVDLDELPALARRLRLFSLNRFNVFSLHERDHGDGSRADDGSALRRHVERQLRGAGLPAPAAIRLLAMPRILGYAFNPLSVYFCHGGDGALEAVLYEVNNTFGERHGYLIAVDGPARADGRIVQRCAKVLHVSPFLPLDLQYVFRLDPPCPTRGAMSIGVSAHDAVGALLNARFDAQRRALDDAALAQVFFSHPLLTLKVIAAIHWEAMRLFLKGVRLQSKPTAPAVPVTFVEPTEP